MSRVSKHPAVHLLIVLSVAWQHSDCEQGHLIFLLISPYLGGSPCTLLVFQETEPRILAVVVITLNVLVTFI